MACQIQPDKYNSVVLNLISLDPNTYNNYDNAAKLVLGSNLTPEQKMLSVHNLAYIYKQMAELDTENYFQPGQAAAVLDAMAAIDDAGEYVQKVSEMMDVKSPAKLRLKTLEKKIDELGTKKSLLPREVMAGDGLFTMFSNYFAVTQFDNAEEREKTLDELTTAIRQAISEIQQPQAINDLLNTQLDSILDKLQKKSDYIALSEVADAAQLNNVLVTLTNGQKVDAIRQEEQFFQIMPDQSLQPIDESEVVSAIDTRLEDPSRVNTGEQVFYEDTLLSSFTIKALDPEQRISVLRKLESMPNPGSGVRIFAVRNNDTAQQRLDRVKAAATGEYSLRSLENRNHITYENSVQQSYLRSTPNGKILTMTMPTAEQQPFTLVGEIIGTGEKFYIYPSDNFAFVNSDNSTESVDFTNPGHLELVKNLSVKRNFLGDSQMTDADVRKLASSVEKWSGFRDSMMSKLQEQFDGGAQSVDVTGDFLESYEINSKRERPTKTLLSNEINNDPTLSKAVTVVTLDKEGNVIDRGERNLPFYYTRFGTKNPYKLVPFLKGNEAIEVKNAKGKLVNISQQAYAEQVLGLDDPEKIQALLKSTDQNNKNLILRFNKTGDLGYRIIDPTYTLSHLEEFATFIVEMADVLTNAENKEADVRNFDITHFTFEITGSNVIKDRRNAPLYLNFSTDFKKNLQIEIRPNNAVDRYGFIRERDPGTNKYKYAQAFNFPVKESVFINLAKRLTGEGDLVKRVKEAHPVLKDLDLSKKQDLFEFYSQVTAIAADKTPSPEIKALADRIIEVRTEFAKYLKETVIDKLEEKTKVVPQFMEMLKEDFTYNGVFKPEVLVVDEDDNGLLVPKITYSPRYTPKNGVDQRERARTNLNNYKLLNAGRNQLAIVSKTVTPTVVSENKAPVVATEKPVHVQGPIAAPTQQDIEDNDLPDIDMIFSLAEGQVATETEEERLVAAEWLSQNLPQFELDRANMADVIDLSKVDGTVLGAFKDKVIYLNEAIKSKGVVYHEAFHGVFRHLMTFEEREKLVKAVRNNKTHSAKFTEAALKEFARERGFLYNKEKMANLQAEEILADGFQNFMNNKKAAPKTLLGKFMEMLKKLLDFFMKNKDFIEATYNRVQSGYYSTAAVQSGMYDGKVAFELIPGLRSVQKFEASKSGVGVKNSMIGVEEQNQLVSLVTYYIMKDTVAGENFDERFDRITKLILDAELNLDVLIAKNPAKKDQIIEKYGNLVKQYRFILGARMRGEQLYDLNNSGREEYNEKVLSNVVKNVATGEEQDNSLGTVSYNMLKEMVKKQLDSVAAILEGKESRSVDAAIMEKAINGDQIEDDERAEDKEETESADFDSALNEHNRLESLPRQVREFLALVRYDQEVDDLSDGENKFTFPRMINGDRLFGQLLKISSELEPGDIIPNIKRQIKQLREDGYINESNDMKAVYDALNDKVAFDADGVPQKNQQLYNVLVDTLHGTEIDYVMVNISSNITEIDQDFGEKDFSTNSFSIKDKVLYEDISKKKKDIVNSLITTRAQASENFDEYTAKVEKLLQAVNKITDSNHILSDINSQEARLISITNELHTAMQEVGINMPKSLLRMSILAIDEIDNGKVADIEGDIRDHYKAHNRFIAEKKFLERDFFVNLANIMTRAIATGTTQDSFARLLDDQNTKDKTVNGFNAILGKAATYIAKYDPKDLPSTARNAEGKPIYRYIKYTPVLTIAQQLRTKGLEETLAQDPYYASQLKNFFGDNYMLQDIINGDDTVISRGVKLFLEHFNVSLFGGAAQSIGGKFKEGTAFKDMDERSLYLLNMMMFLNQNTYTNAEGETIRTYMRSYSQLESSGTNFLVSSLNRRYANTKGLIKNKDGTLKFVDDLQNVVRQEYNRIQREWSTRIERADNFNSEEKNDNILNYNAVHGTDPTTADTEGDNKKKKLRAYMFNMLPDFFEAESNTELNQDLIDAAKSGLKFEEMPEELLKELRESLNTYAQSAVDAHFNKLVNLGALRKNVDFKRLSSGEFAKQADGKTAQPIVYYTSDLIATTLKVNGISIGDALDNYQKTEGNFEVTGGAVAPKKNIRGLVEDAFFNHWANSLYFNQLFDGDMAMNVKDPVDYFKRHKRFLAAGSTMKEGFHKVAYVNTISAMVSDKYPTKGPYYSVEEIYADTSLTEEQQDDLAKEFGSQMYDIFDGQSISSLMHQMDMHETTGRLKPSLQHIMIAKHYRALEEHEVRKLENAKIVNNPKKTVTASRTSYHKLSENYIDRNDVSRLVLPEGVTRAQAYDLLHGLYTDIYSLRKQRQAMIKTGQEGAVGDIDAEIKTKVEATHKYFEPLPHREQLHHLLNSMEYYQVDQMMDTTASKNATMLPVDMRAELSKIREGNKKYINLEISSLDVENKYKYLQVETSGVKEKAKFSVQSKALIAADLVNLSEIAEASGREITAEDRKAMQNVADALVRYQSTLREVGQSNLANLKTILRKDGDFQIGKVFNMIRESLAEQGAPTNTLKLFEVDSAGQPVHSPNLPGIRNMLEYYFFSQYSKHVTDEKGSGFKNIHISSYGYDVLENEDGSVVPTEEYKRNPEKYPNVKARKLGVTTELNSDGTKTYYVEAIMPKPFFKNKRHERIYMEKLNKMFGVRIPTEDKRSMVAIKVVDFMDGSNLNGIILPHIVHILSGSDFDVDSLYGQTYATYMTLAGQPVVYGEYDDYDNDQQGKFAEFIHYMMKDPDMAPLIKAREKELSTNESYSVSQETLDLLLTVGFDESDLENTINFAQLQSEYDILNQDIAELVDIRDEAKADYINSIRKTELDPKDRDAWAERKELGAEVGEYNAELGEKRAERNEYGRKLNRANSFRYAALKAEAGLQVLVEYGIPVTQKAFSENPAYAQAVRPAFQNKNLTAKLDIISNEAVFNHLYINERSSTERFEQIFEKFFGKNIKEYKNPYNPFSIDGVIATKTGNAMNKDGIGITANINKFLALASQYGLELNPEKVIWKYYSRQGEELSFKNYTKFGTLNEDNQRVIELIGNVLGMFADGAKKPIPSALGMNEHNAGISLAMIGVGLSPEFAIGFNFLPEVKNAMHAVQAAQFALSESGSKEMIWPTDALKTEMTLLDKKYKDAKIISSLLEKGVITEKSWIHNLQFTDKLVIDFTPKVINEAKLAANTLTPSEIGYTVSVITNPETGTTEKLSEAEATVVLLSLYTKQAMQTSGMRRAGSLLNLFKKLNPSFVAFDRLMANIEELHYGLGIFTEESTAKMFGDEQIWPLMMDAVKDLNKQSSKLFLERSEFFAPLTRVFGPMFDDPKSVARILTSFVALQKYQTVYPAARASSPAMKEMYAEDTQNLLDTFKADYWFTNTLDQDLEAMRKKYPNNKFLQLLRVDQGNNMAMNAEGKMVREKSIRMINKSKLTGKFADEVASDADKLMNDENLFMRKLYYQELAKTGLQYKQGSFLQFLNNDLQLPLSQYVNEFVKLIEDSSTSRQQMNAKFAEFLHTGEGEPNVHAFFENLFTQMAYAAIQEKGNKRIKRSRYVSAKGSNVIRALDVPEETKEREKKELLRDIVAKINGIPGGNVADRYNIKNKAAGEKDARQTLIFDLTAAADVKGITPTVVEGVARAIGVQVDTIEGDKVYSWPYVLRVGDATYVLDSVRDIVAGTSVATNVVDKMIQTGFLDNQGYKAKYKLLPSAPTGEMTVNPIAYTTDQVQRYLDLTKRKVRLGAAPAIQAKPATEKKVETPATPTDMNDGTVDSTAMLNQLLAGTLSEEQQLSLDLQDLNLTPQVLRYLYEQGRKSLGKKEFAKAVTDMIASMRATNTNEQIIEKIKCL